MRDELKKFDYICLLTIGDADIKIIAMITKVEEMTACRIYGPIILNFMKNKRNGFV